MQNISTEYLSATAQTNMYSDRATHLVWILTGLYDRPALNDFLRVGSTLHFYIAVRQFVGSDGGGAPPGRN